MEEAPPALSVPSSPPQVRRSHRSIDKKSSSSNSSRSSSKGAKSKGKSASSATIGRSVSEDSLDREVGKESIQTRKSEREARSTKKVMGSTGKNAKVGSWSESRSDNEGSHHSLLRPPTKEKSKKAAVAARILERRKMLKEKEKERELEAYNKKKVAAVQAIMESNFSKPLTESKFKASFDNLSSTRKRSASSFSRKSEEADTTTSAMTDASGGVTDASRNSGVSSATGDTGSRARNDSKASSNGTGESKDHDDNHDPVGIVVTSPASHDGRYEGSGSRGARIRKIRQRVGSGAAPKLMVTGLPVEKITPPRDYTRDECKQQSLLSPASRSDGSDGGMGSIATTSTRYGPLNASTSDRSQGIAMIGDVHPISPDGGEADKEDGDDWDDNVVPSPLGGKGSSFSPERSVRSAVSEPLPGEFDALGIEYTGRGEVEILTDYEDDMQEFYDCPHLVPGESREIEEATRKFADEVESQGMKEAARGEWEDDLPQTREEFVESEGRLPPGSSRYDALLGLDRGDDHDDNDEKIPGIEPTASEASVPSILEKDNVFHENAAAAVVALLSPPRSEGDERFSPSKQSQEDEGPKEAEVAPGAIVASPRRRFDPVGVVFASTEAARYQDKSWEAGELGKYKSGCDFSSAELAPLIDAETEQVLETIRDRMVEPSRQLSDLLSIIHSNTPIPETGAHSQPGAVVVYKRKLLNFDDEDDEKRMKSLRGHMVRRKNACGALKVLTTRTENRVRLAWTVGVLPSLTAILNDSGPNGADVTFRDVSTRLDYIEARRRAVASLLNLVQPEENRTLVFHSPGLVQAMGKCIREDDGMARQGCCACLTFLAKAKQNRLLMVEVPGLVDAITKVIRPPPRESRSAPRSDLPPNRYLKQYGVDGNGEGTEGAEESNQIIRVNEKNPRNVSPVVVVSADDDDETMDETTEDNDEDTNADTNDDYSRDDETEDDDTRDDVSHEDGILKSRGSTLSAIDSSFSRDSIESLESLAELVDERDAKEKTAIGEATVVSVELKVKDDLTSTPVRKGRTSSSANRATVKTNGSRIMRESESSSSRSIKSSRDMSCANSTKSGSSQDRKDHRGSVSTLSTNVNRRRTESESTALTAISEVGYGPDISAEGTVDAYDEKASNFLQGARVSVFATILHLVKTKENAYKLARHRQLIMTLVQLSRKHASPMHSRAVTLLAHMTRHNSNTKHMVFRVKYLLPSLVAATHSRSADSRRYGCYALQNLSGDRHCRQEMANTHNLLESLCLRARDDGFEDEQLAAIAAMKNLTDEPANIIPMTNVPDFVGTLVHISQGQAEATPVMKYMACDGLATLSHWLRKMATSGIDGEKRRHAYAKATANGMPASGVPSTALVGYQPAAGMHIPTVETIEWNQFQ